MVSLSSALSVKPTQHQRHSLYTFCSLCVCCSLFFSLPRYAHDICAHECVCAQRSQYQTHSWERAHHCCYYVHPQSWRNVKAGEVENGTRQGRHTSFHCHSMLDAIITLYCGHIHTPQRTSRLSALWFLLYCPCPTPLLSVRRPYYYYGPLRAAFHLCITLHIAQYAFHITHPKHIFTSETTETLVLRSCGRDTILTFPVQGHFLST